MSQEESSATRSDGQPNGSLSYPSADAVHDSVQQAGSSQTRTVNPGEVIEVNQHQDDNETVLTDLQTIEYEIGQPSLFPSAEAQDMSSHRTEYDNLYPVMEGDRPALTQTDEDAKPSANGLSGSHSGNKKSAPEKAADSNHTPSQNWKADLQSEIEAMGPDNPQRFISAIQPMPAPARRPTPKAHYDNSGNITKNSMVSDPSIAGRVGAFANAGPAPFDVRRNGLPSPPNVRLNENGSTEENTPESALEEAPQESDQLQPEDHSVKNSIQQRRMIIAGIMLLVFVVVAIAVALILTKEKPSNSLGEEDIPTTESYIAPIPNLSNATLSDLEVEGSLPQRAYHFITQDPGWNDYEDWRRQQRFAMTCIYMAFNEMMEGSAPERLSRGSYLQHECEWGATGLIERCDNDGVIRSLYAYRNGARGKGYFPPEVALLPYLEALKLLWSTVVVDIEQLLPLHIPDSFLSLERLEILRSDLAGPIPSTLGLLTGLTHLDLSNNNLEFDIPTELGLLSSLTTIVLSMNQFSGRIPEEIGNLPSLVIFDAEENEDLEPYLPPGLCAGNHTEWEVLKTDWCSNPTACCSI